MRLFGGTTSTFTGAFYAQDKTKKYTVAQAKKIIDDWGKKGVK